MYIPRAPTHGRMELCVCGDGQWGSDWASDCFALVAVAGDLSVIPWLTEQQCLALLNLPTSPEKS